MSRVPPQASGGLTPPGGEDIEQLEELGDDAIIAQQQGAHAPAPRAQVTEEARSIVISDHPPQGRTTPAPGPAAPQRGQKRRSERTEKTVVIRDRRQLEELRREMTKPRAPVAMAPAGKGLLLWVIVGVAAFLTGGLVALFATRETTNTLEVAPVASQALPPIPAAASAAEPPSVSIDELPIEGSKNR